MLAKRSIVEQDILEQMYVVEQDVHDAVGDEGEGVPHAARPSTTAPPATPHSTIFKFRTAASTPHHLQMCSCSSHSSSSRGRPDTSDPAMGTTHQLLLASALVTKTILWRPRWCRRRG
ncbi:unnamed protein product [Triticum turgidum subsp. durum]|uniref:Uncharacterized protein n=1 Tax=Triticum turgidum subsp. durum TaxID=4567 RepID=A0A9R0WIK3_TRITD|nr:unnamed protein product [Triticum turgidum subsp. durum]